MEGLYYVDDGGSRRGPVSAQQLRALLEDGEVDGLTPVFLPGASTAAPLSEIQSLKQALQAAEDDDVGAPANAAPAVSSSKQPISTASRAVAPPAVAQPAGPAVTLYFYTDASGTQSGPVAAEAFASLAAAGYVTSSSLVWTASMPTWAPLLTVPAIAPLVQPHLQPQPPASAQPHAATSTAAAVAPNGAGHKRKRADSADEGEGERGSGGSDGAEGAEGAAAAAAAATGAVGDGQAKSKKRRRDDSSNCWVYVTGLPVDGITVEDVARHFKKCGILALDYAAAAATTTAAAAQPPPRIKLYRDEEGRLKGDASVCYLKPESVALAVSLLDGAELLTHDGKPAAVLSVQQAEFTGGGSGGGSKKGKKKDKTEKDKEGGAGGKKEAAAAAAARARALEQRVALSWAEEGDEEADATGRGIKIVVLRNMFTPEESRQPGFLDELQEDVVPELETRCGAVDGCTVFQRHPHGVIVVKFKAAGAAATCLQVMNGRFFGGRRIAAQFYDGVTDFSAEAEGLLLAASGAAPADAAAAARKRADQEEQQRLDDFGKWLESQEVQLEPPAVSAGASEGAGSGSGK